VRPRQQNLTIEKGSNRTYLAGWGEEGVVKSMTTSKLGDLPMPSLYNVNKPGSINLSYSSVPQIGLNLKLYAG